MTNAILCLLAGWTFGLWLWPAQIQPIPAAWAIDTFQERWFALLPLSDRIEDYR